MILLWYDTYCALQQWYSRTICAQTMHDLEQHCFRVCSSISDTSRHPMFSSRQLYSKLSSRGGPSWCLPHSQRHRHQSETRKDLISGVATCLTFQRLKPREPFWISLNFIQLLLVQRSLDGHGHGPCLCGRRSFASAKDLLRYLFDSLHMRATFAHPSSWQALAERRDGDFGHSLLYEKCQKK